MTGKDLKIGSRVLVYEVDYDCDASEFAFEEAEVVGLQKISDNETRVELSYPDTSGVFKLFGSNHSAYLKGFYSRKAGTFAILDENLKKKVIASMIEELNKKIEGYTELYKEMK